MHSFRSSQKYFMVAGLALMVYLGSAFINPVKKQPTSLKAAFEGDFLIGVAINGFQATGRDTLSGPVIKKEFNSLTPENSMKWERIHPEPGKYNFRFADRIVEMGLEYDDYLAGHVLVWHQQTPDWVFHDSEGNLTTRDTLLMRMKEHIFTVVGRYKGKVNSWDVVNEAIDDRGELRKSLWYQIIGEDYIDKAFIYAREADPGATLIYNDYSLANPAKRDGVVRMVRELQSRGIPIDGIGLQAHYGLTSPSIQDIEASILAFSEVGMRVMFTELDVTVLPDPSSRGGADISRRVEYQSRLNPYTEGLPDSVQVALADRYRDLFTLFKAQHEHIDRVTFWGVHDGLSWKNFHPVRGRTNYPLLFDREAKPKLAYDAVLQVAQSN